MSKKVRIGKTDLEVTPVGLGANAVGGHNLYPNLDEEEGKNVVRTAIEQDMDFIDTAFSYGKGRSEELIGEVLKETGRRQDIVLATKGAHIYKGDQIIKTNDPDFLKETVEASLKRLQTDYIDLFYIHHPDEETPKDEAVGALKDLKDEGKIRAIGVSNFSIEQLKEANKDGYVDVIQDHYNLLNREVEDTLFPYVLENDLSFVPFFPFASGILAGHYTKDTTFNDFRKDMPHFQGEAFLRNLEKVDKLRNLANARETEVANLVLAWYLSQEVIDVVIPGAKRTEQVESNLRTMDVYLSEEEKEEISQIFNEK
ncbi:aldo/keto reductase [Virgibacillus sp. MSJ-26]|uniref:aldo/keto reductase n=1 Tax=Virgibacillus sp. MSJ-26 TaxID=2841522 RepID=UPI001C109A90|nr:aldo/keto reductase [Virgibacillus sp. MSJ-26]MBU5466073.1 aldo/keto reductase [Virgibacillus sp. MSJ-26]